MRTAQVQHACRRLVGAVLLLAAAFSLLGTSDSVNAAAVTRSSPPAHAAHATLAPVALSPPSAEITKATLADTSTGAPALWTTTGTVRAVVAWTGTDTAHYLNVATFAIGTTFYNKVTLPKASPVRPTVTRASTGGPVSVAWIGTDSAHTLNVLYYVYGARAKLTLWGETSTCSPALVSMNSNTLLLAWTGTNAGRSLNVQTIYVDVSLTKGPKAVLASFSSLTGPSLSYELSRSEYLLSWSATSPANHVAISNSTDAAQGRAGTRVLLRPAFPLWAHMPLDCSEL